MYMQATLRVVVFEHHSGLPTFAGSLSLTPKALRSSGIGFNYLLKDNPPLFHVNPNDILWRKSA